MWKAIVPEKNPQLALGAAEEHSWISPLQANSVLHVKAVMQVNIVLLPIIRIIGYQSNKKGGVTRENTAGHDLCVSLSFSLHPLQQHCHSGRKRQNENQTLKLWFLCWQLLESLWRRRVRYIPTLSVSHCRDSTVCTPEEETVQQQGSTPDVNQDNTSNRKVGPSTFVLGGKKISQSGFKLNLATVVSLCICFQQISRFFLKKWLDTPK